MTNTGCQCESPGYCERHSILKTPHWHHLCQTREDYFLAWEEGRGPGQVSTMRRQKRKVINSGIGDILAKHFESIGIVAVPGCPCKQIRGQLNQMTPDQVASDLDGWAQKIQRSAKKWKELKGGIWSFIPAPPLAICKEVLRYAVEKARNTWNGPTE